MFAGKTCGKTKENNPKLANVCEEEKRSTSFDDFLIEQLKDVEFRREYEAECEKLKNEKSSDSAPVENEVDEQ